MKNETYYKVALCDTDKEIYSCIKNNRETAMAVLMGFVSEANAGGAGFVRLTESVYATEDGHIAYVCKASARDVLHAIFDD